MNIMDVIKLRKSVRSYDMGKGIDDITLNKILDAGRLAPSAKNVQEWKYIVVKDRTILEKLVPACKNQKFVGEGAAVVVGCSELTDYVMTCGQLAYPIDLAISMEHMSLMAAELGIGSCWIGAFYEDQVKKLLGVPPNVKIVSLLVLGYPKEDLSKIETTPRKKMSEIVCYEKWGF